MKKLILLLALVPNLIFGQAYLPTSNAITFDWWAQTIYASPAHAFTTEYQAILNRATALGYTKPSAAQQVKQNQLIVDLKAAGIWTQLDVFYVFATDGSSDFATLNWINPLLYQCSKVNSPTFTANQGFAGNGTTSNISSSFNFSTAAHFSVNSACVGVFIYQTPPLGYAIFGSSSTVNIRGVYSSATIQRMNSATNGSLNMTNAGYFALDRSDANTLNGYNPNKLTTSELSTGITSGTLDFMKIFSNNYSPVGISMGYVSSSLSATLHSLFNSSFNTYKTSL